MGKSTAKGTRFEGRVLEEYLLPIWPKAERAPKKGILDFGDFVGINGWLVEAKWRATTQTWRIAAWVLQILHKIQTQDPTAPWTLIFSADKRKKGTPPLDLALMPAEQWKHQMQRLAACTCGVKENKHGSR